MHHFSHPCSRALYLHRQTQSLSLSSLSLIYSSQTHFHLEITLTLAHTHTHTQSVVPVTMSSAERMLTITPHFDMWKYNSTPSILLCSNILLDVTFRRPNSKFELIAVTYWPCYTLYVRMRTHIYTQTTQDISWNMHECLVFGVFGGSHSMCMCRWCACEKENRALTKPTNVKVNSVNEARATPAIIGIKVQKLLPCKVTAKQASWNRRTQKKLCHNLHWKRYRLVQEYPS